MAGRPWNAVAGGSARLKRLTVTGDGAMLAAALENISQTR